MATALIFLFSAGIHAQTISPLVGEAIRAFRNSEFETAREKADKAILSGNYSMTQRRDLYYIRGYGLFLVSNYPEALKDFDMVLDIKANDKQSQLLKAECYYYENKFDRAIEEFYNAEKLWKSADDNYNNMAAYIKSMRGKCQYKLGKYEVALNELNKAALLDSTVMDIWETFGDVNFTLKNYDTSIYFFSKAIELYNKNNDNSIYSWVERGKVYDSLDKQDEAILNFKEAIRIKSFEREPYWLVGKSYEKKKKIDSSLIYFHEALARTDSEDVESMKLLNWEIGYMYKKNDKFDDAITYFQKALKIDDHYKEAYADMADCYVENKQYKQSIEPYQRAIYVYQQDKKDSLILSSLYLKLGDVYMKTKDQSNAKENYLSALKWNKGNNNASMNQANVLYANKKFKEAIPFFKKVIDNPVPAEPVVMQEAYYKQGMCYLDFKDTGQAIASFEKSMSYKTTHDEAQLKLSEIYFAKKQFDKVGGLLTNLDSSLKKFDTAALTDMYYKKAMSELAGGKPAEAKADFAKCIGYSGNNKKAYHGLGDAAMQTKEYPAAEEAYTHCLELYKNDKDSLYKVYLYRAQAKSKQNNFAEAVEDIETANKLKPGNINITKSLIETNIAAGFYDKAVVLINTFQKTLKTTDLNHLATCYYYKAQCNIGAGNTDNALNDLAKAMSYNRNYPEAQKLLNDLNGNPNAVPSANNAAATNNTNTSTGKDNTTSVPTPPVVVAPVPKVVAAAPTAKVKKTDKKSKKPVKGHEVAAEPEPAPVVVTPKTDSIVTETKTEPVVETPPAPKVEPVVVEPKKDTVVPVPAPVVEPVKKDTVVAAPPPAPKVEAVVLEPKKDTVVPAPTSVVEPVKKDTVVLTPPPAPKIEPVVVEPKKDTVVPAPTPVVEPVKKDTVIVTSPPAPKVESVVVEPKKDTVVPAPAAVIEPVKKDTVVVTPPIPPAPKVEPVVEPKKDTVVPAPAAVVEPVKKDTVIVTPPPPPAPKIEPVVVEPKKDTVVPTPAPVVEPVKKDTVVVTPPIPSAPKVEPVVAEPKKDTVVPAPAAVIEPVKKDTVVVTPPPAPKIEPVVIEPKKETVVPAPTPVVEPVKKDTVVAPKVEPKKDSAVAPPVPVTPKVDSVKTEVNKDSTLPKEIKKENDHLQSDDRNNEDEDNKNGSLPLKEEANKEYYKEG